MNLGGKICDTALALATGMLMFVHVPATAVEIELNGNRFTLPDGMEIELVARPPLVERPICADFDELGRLYVATSSGLTEKAESHLEKKPHRIMRLEDVDGDGEFDKSTVFADKMMFPEGTLWYDGSLYVGAPPEIWKLTDTNDDGTADQREVWFDAKTLTGCANDLHGPYLGPDGWIYWCKGAFAEQTYPRAGREPLVTKAAHIFRRHPQGEVVEPVMTGGMDNPIEIVFTPGGERIFTTTFLTHPGPGQRDGIIHAIYGGVYGKVHHVLDGHPRTGDIMPILAHHGGASAPCGLARLEMEQLGKEYKNDVLACSFNMRRIFRHVLSPAGASFVTSDSDFLVSDNLDFHPTDVMEDGDGSLLVIDTGGWYKVCCPTSRLAKPDILGAIYRVRRTEAHHVQDPRGKKIDWPANSNHRLVELLADGRFMVRRRARQLLGQRGVAAIEPLAAAVKSSVVVQQRLEAVWALTQIQNQRAMPGVRTALQDEDENVRQAALHSISVRRDEGAVEQLIEMLKAGSPHNRRAAAEALGRIGAEQATLAILDATADVTDRAEEHSLIYALIEPGRPETVRRGLGDIRPRVRRAAMIALDQMPESHLDSTEVIPLLTDDDPVLNDAAWWIVSRHPEWAAETIDCLRQEVSLKHVNASRHSLLSQRLATFANDPVIQQLMGESLANPEITQSMRETIMDAMKVGRPADMPESWSQPLGDQLASRDIRTLELAVGTVHALTQDKPHGYFVETLREVTANGEFPVDLRLQSLAAISGDRRDLDAETISFVCAGLSIDNPVRTRSLAIDVLASSPLSADQLVLVADAMIEAGPMELRRAVEIFGKSNDAGVGMRLVAALERCPASTSLPIEQLNTLLSVFGDKVVQQGQGLVERIEAVNRDKISKLESIVKLVPQGDVRRGERVFHSSKAACISCHGIGYVGGRIGPDLSNVGSIRSERDLLESILFPSVSLVQSYEPEQIVTNSGLIYSGLVRDENKQEILLQLDAEKSVRIPVEEIDERQPSSVSVMPDGLDQHFTPQQLADLIVFLKSPR